MHHLLHHITSQVIPLPLVRRLALRKLRLTEEDDEDDEESLVVAANAVKGKHVHVKVCFT
jgi:hypothetical protein